MSKKLLNLCMVALLSVVSTTAWALSEVNGFYQIGSAEDIAAFAQLVNGGNVYANAVLTADIDLGDITTKISNDANKYQGLFDGAGHTITINLADRTDGEGPALFRNLGNRGIIQNLKVQGNITTGTYKHTAAIANYSVGLIRNCYVDVTITSSFGDDADASIGGIAGQLNRPAIIENCLAKVKILGTTTHKCGGLAAWVDEHHVSLANNLVINDVESNFNYSDGKSAGLARVGTALAVVNLETYNANSYTNRPTAANGNNYVTNNWGVDNTGTTVVTSEDLASGKVCFQLNSDQSHIGWVQNIGTDPFPVPAPFGTGQVYASAATNCQGMAEGDVTFSNSGTVQATAHTYDKYGVCTTCGQFNFNCFEFDDPTRFDPVTKSVLIGSADDLYLAEGWNRLQNGFKLNMKMVNDVTCTPPTGQLIFNAGDWMDSNFDGDGHTITINFVDIKENCAAFLPYFDGNFENVIMHGSISTANQYAGSIAGRFYGNGQKIRNVFSDITINTTKTGDNTTGGFVGIDAANVTYENCIYAGDLIGVPGTTCLGGFAGWANDKTYYKNCAFLGTMTNGGGDSHAISRNNGQADCTNVYSTFQNGTDLNKYTYVTSDDVESGKLCYLLNGNEGGVERFYQLLGTDPMPMPFAKDGALVYATAYCGEVGNAAGYTNTPTEPAVVDHQFENGFCSACGEWDETYMTPVDGWFDISNGAELAWWSIYESKNEITNARLTADIDMTGYNQFYIPVGKDGKLFVGEFDGQGHTISNLNIGGGDYTGLFGRIGGGADIKNFVLDNTCSITGASYVGIIGGTNGSGKVYITNVGNEGTVAGVTGANVSGIIGVDMGGSADMYITNCFVTGAIKGGRESATICSWSSGGSVVENCYSIATLEGKYGNEDSFTRGSASCVNCYEIEGVGTQNNKTGTNRTNLISATEVANGALCYKLNGEQNAVERFYQKLGEGGDAHPTSIAKEGALVYVVAGEYRCDGLPLGEDVSYSNEPSGVIPDHTFVDGICSVCGELEKDADGYMKIINAQTLVAFTAIVNTDGKADTKARVYADIDMTGITDYYPIGCEAYIYTGEFDGQFHTISNLVINNGSYDYQGLFGRIGGGADIKNLILDSSCSITGNAFVGVIGGTNGAGDVYVTNVGNEGTITSNAQNAAGILGVDMNTSANLHITNCYVTGAVNGHHESATICGWSNANSVVKNCWSSATLTGIYGTGSFTRGYTAIVNSYEIEGVGQQDGVNKFAADEVASGSLCAKLGAGSGWYQKIGEDAHPVWDETSGFVVEITEAGYATMYLPEAVEAPEGVSVFTGEYNGDWLKLNPVEGTVPANEPVVLKGEVGFYSFVPAEAAVQTDELTWQALGLPETNSTYTGFSGISFTSAAEYAGLASSGTGQYIQLRSKNSNEGIVTTVSGGKLKSLTIAYNAGTDSKRVLDIYAKNEPYEAASDLYNETLCGEKIGSIAYDEGTLTFTVEGDYQYVGIRSNYGALYLDELSFEWEGSVPNIEGNVLIGADEDITANGSQYILAMPEGKQVGFWKSTPGTTIKAGKAYLEPETTGETTGVKAFFFSGDDATGIANVEKTIENGIIYNLAGQRISKMQKGINIVNGKKVLK